MKLWKLAYGGVVLLAGACGSKSNDPCDGVTSGNVCLYAGTGEQGYNVDNPTAHRLDSQFYWPVDLSFGPDGRPIIVDFNNHKIRRVEKDDSVDLLIGTDYEGDGPPEMQDRLPLCNPPGALGTTVALNHPTAVTFGPDGMVYLSAWHDNKIRALNPENDMVYSLAGDSYGFSGDGGPACMATFSQPKDVTFDAAGNMYLIDQRNVRIREISQGTPMYAPNQMITTWAGVGTKGNSGDGGPALQAQFGFDTTNTPQPTGALVFDEQRGKMYVADSDNNRIRSIDMTTGIIDGLAGDESAMAGFSGDGGQALQATLSFPVDMELGPDGRLYEVERMNHVVRAIDLDSGIIQTVAGQGGVSCDVTDASAKCPDHGSALDMEFWEPNGITFDAQGNLYVADTRNNRIMKVVK